MTKVLAIYDKGVFRPTQPVEMADGAQVELTIHESVAADESPPLIDVLEEIARLPMEGGKDGFSGADHDRHFVESGVTGIVP